MQKKIPFPIAIDLMRIIKEVNEQDCIKRLGEKVTTPGYAAQLFSDAVTRNIKDCILEGLGIRLDQTKEMAHIGIKRALEGMMSFDSLAEEDYYKAYTLIPEVSAIVEAIETAVAKEFERVGIEICIDDVYVLGQQKTI